MKQDILKAGDCKKLTGVSECSPTCTAGYDFMMDGSNYKKCKNSAFFWKVCPESMDYIEKMVESELKLCDIDQREAYQLLLQLEKQSAEANTLYEYFDDFISLLKNIKNMPIRRYENCLLMRSNDICQKGRKQSNEKIQSLVKRNQYKWKKQNSDVGIEKEPFREWFYRGYDVS